MTQKRNASVARAERVTLEDQRVPRRANEAKKLGERVQALGTAVRTKALKGRKWLETSLQQKKAEVEAKVKHARVELVA